ncbi:MAG: M28 family peptidase [Phycisphaera sp.]|nr:M28 family peptidase [Phycisphaera sp.]
MKDPVVEQLQRDVLAIATEDGRLPGTEPHARARQYLVDRLTEIGCVPFRGDAYELPYQGRGPCADQSFVNVIGVCPGDPEQRHLHDPLLIAAHYDSVIAAPCADDNAAAIAIALRVAERLIATPTHRDVLIALFDAEEPPHYHGETMGSMRFYEDQRDGVEFHAALVMDLVGHDVAAPVPIPGASMLVPSIPRLLFVMGSESHPALPDVVRHATDHADKLAVVTALNRYVGDVSDHFAFRINEVPFLFLSCGRWQHYHKPSDTPDKLNYHKMARIAGFLEHLTRGLDEVTTGRAREHDTTAFDIAMFKHALGRIGTPIAMKAAGLDTFETREDFDKIAARLMAGGLY